MIAFLHTNKAHIAYFEALVRAENKTIKIQHHVNKTILDNALKTGITDAIQFEKEIDYIRKDKPSLIICTCSTYGAESDKFDDVYRIDKPIIEFIIANFSKIGLVYTANSTKTVSENLMRSISVEKNKAIEIVNVNCSELWPYFEKDDLENYNKGIAEKTIEKATLVDVFFLAQASMAGAKTYLTALDKDVFTSPKYGIKELLKLV